MDNTRVALIIPNASDNPPNHQGAEGGAERHMLLRACGASQQVTPRPSNTDPTHPTKPVPPGRGGEEGEEGGREQPPNPHQTH